MSTRAGNPGAGPPTLPPERRFDLRLTLRRVTDGAHSLRQVLATGAARVRAERGLSDAAAAELMRSYGLTGWQAGTISQVEARGRPLSMEELLLLCAAYELSVLELAGPDAVDVELAAGARLPPRPLRPPLRDAGGGARGLAPDAPD